MSLALILLGQQAIPDGGFFVPEAGPADTTTTATTTGFVYFGSNGKDGLEVLSNFHEAPIRLCQADVTARLAKRCPSLAMWQLALGGQVTFPSSEHAWQALKAHSFRAFTDFTTEGRLGTLDAASVLPFMPAKLRLRGTATEQQRWALGKAAFWAKKQNVGILAKWAANKKYAKALGWTPGVDLYYGKETANVGFDEMQAVWLDLLRLKYAQNTRCRDVLLATGDSYLLECVRGAVREPDTEFWGGCLDRTRDQIVGRNAMGRFHMALREELRASRDV